jgi:hypothetical protein
VRIEVARNSGSVSSEIIPETAAMIPGSQFSDNKGAVMEITLGSVQIKVSNQVNPQLLAEAIRLLGGNAIC